MAKKTGGKGSTSPRGDAKAARGSQVRGLVEAILTNQERAKKLYQRAGEDLAALVAKMRPGQTVETRFGTVAMTDAFADGRLTAFKNTAIARYSLRVVS
jgi:hypothetical protein